MRLGTKGRRAALLVVCAALTLLWAAPARALPSGNLLGNPGAEAPPSEAGEVLSTPQGWTQTEALGPDEQGAYDSCYGGSESEREVVERSVGEAIGGGARFFFGGTVSLSTLRQDIAVDPGEAAGRQLLLGGDFGGYQGQEDHATLAAHFLDGLGTELGSAATAPVTAAERGFATSLLPRQASATVPAGTATIRFVLSQVREEGIDSDGYADNLYATFDGSAPAPVTASGDGRCPLAAPTPPSTPSAPAPAPSPSPSPAPSPTVAITSGPPRESAATAARFTFTGTAGGSFECSLDGGAWRPCASGGDFGPVRPGDHRFQVREKLGGRTSAPASYRWTVDLPKQCVLRVARARVFAFARKSRARLVIHYTSYRPARVTVAYALAGKRGKLVLGSASARFRKAGVFRLPVRLRASQLARLRAARSFTVRFKIAKTPRSCGRYYAKRLTIPKRISGQTVWFQSDSRFAPGG